MQPIHIPEHLKSKCGSNLHWDLYKVDVKLISGEIRYGLSVRERAVFEPTSGEDPKQYNFQDSDIAGIRPATVISRIRTCLRGW